VRLIEKAARSRQGRVFRLRLAIGRDNVDVTVGLEVRLGLAVYFVKRIGG